MRKELGCRVQDTGSNGILLKRGVMVTPLGVPAGLCYFGTPRVLQLVL